MRECLLVAKEADMSARSTWKAWFDRAPLARCNRITDRSVHRRRVPHGQLLQRIQSSSASRLLRTLRRTVAVLCLLLPALSNASATPPEGEEAKLYQGYED